MNELTLVSSIIEFFGVSEQEIPVPEKDIRDIWNAVTYSDQPNQRDSQFLGMVLATFCIEGPRFD